MWINQELVALSPSDGGLKWKSLTSPPFSRQPFVIDAAGDVYVEAYETSTDVFFYSLDGATGDIQWQIPFKGWGEFRAPTLGANGVIYMVNQAGTGGRVLAVNSASGEILWTSDVRNDFEGEMILGDDGTIYLGSTALDWETGRVKWHLNLDVNSSQLALGPNQILFVSSGDRVYAIDTVAVSLRWTRDIGRQGVYGFGRSLALDKNNLLYVQTHRGIQMINGVDGAMEGVIPFGFRDANQFTDLSLTLASDATLYAKGRDRLVAFSVSAGAPTDGWPTKGRQSTRTHSRQTPGPALVVSASPDQPLLEGTFARLNVLAGGDPPLEYQWFQNGNPIEGAESSHLDIPSFSRLHVGNYRVRVQNELGFTDSDDIRVDFGFPLLADVQGTGAVVLNPPGGIYFSGTEVEIHVTPDTIARFLNWTGDVSSTESVVRVTVDQPKSVLATFGPGAGSVKWQQPIVTENARGLRLQVGPDGTVYATESVNGVSLYTLLLAFDGLTGVEKWRSELFNGMTTPGIGKNNEILVGTKPFLAALDPENGDTQWSYGGGNDGQGLDNVIPATLHDGTIVVVGSQAQAIDAESREKKWMLRLLSPHGPPAVDADDTVYMGGVKLSALRGATGETAWVLPPQVGSSSFGYYSPVLGLDGTLYTLTSRSVSKSRVTIQEKSLMAIDTNDGAVKWSLVSDRINLRDYLPSISVDGTVYLREGLNLVAVDGNSGNRKWTAELNGRFDSVVIDGDGNVLVGASNGVLRAFDGSDGTSLWSFKSDNGRPIVRVVIGPEGMVYALTPTILYAVQGATETRPQWPCESGGDTFRRPYKSE